MERNNPYPEFSSRAPLKEKVDLFEIASEQGKNKMYWLLSFENTSEESESLRSSHQAAYAPYDDNEGEMLDCGDVEDSYEINPTKSGKFITSFYVPPALHSAIIGPRGSKLKELQGSTATLIKVPKPGEPGDVKVTGPSERSVASARTQITLIAWAKRETKPITHFVSVPMGTGDDIRKGYHKFKDLVLRGPKTRGVDGTIFQKVEKLHLTIVTLVLLDEQEVDKAKAVLNSCKDTFGKCFGGGKKITLQGVEIMNDDPSEVDVLYGKVHLPDEDSEKFQKFADEMMELFYKNGLVRRHQYDAVKLHVTLMNSLFRKNDAADNKKGKRETFDASYILKEYKDYCFGTTVLDAVELSVRFTTSSSGYYNAIETIRIK